jgi:phosphatidylserine/phosphatidylglycerophosphate/cardiolipin synthase-like enzyme
LIEAGGGVSMEASVLSAQPDTVLHAPVFETAGFKTGLALANPGTAGTNVSMVLRRNDGSMIGSLTESIGGSHQIARFVSELFPSANDFEGTLVISSTKPLAGLALRYNESEDVFSTMPVSAQGPEVYFSPDGGVSSRIVQEIQRAQSSIDIEMYTFTRTEIANALIAAKNRGVAVRLLADSSEAATPGSVLPRLDAAGISVKRTVGSGGGIMHDKVAIFDRQVLLTGSYNWSTAAEEENDENALFIRTPSLVAAYQATFDALWLTR